MISYYYGQNKIEVDRVEIESFFTKNWAIGFDGKRFYCTRIKTNLAPCLLNIHDNKLWYSKRRKDIPKSIEKRLLDKAKSLGLDGVVMDTKRQTDYYVSFNS